jgi:hypothetical protein
MKSHPNKLVKKKSYIFNNLIYIYISHLRYLYYTWFKNMKLCNKLLVINMVYI